MEFGATYPLNGVKTIEVGLKDIRKFKGAFGVSLKGMKKQDVLAALPPYARDLRRRFPEWKIQFIQQNRDFYKKIKKSLMPGFRQFAVFLQVSRNSEVLDNLLKNISFQPDTSYVSKEAAQKHLIALGVPMQKIVDALVDYRCEDPRDTASFTGVLVTIGEALRRDPDLMATVYRTRPSAVGGHRDVDDDDDTIENFLQGRTDRVGAYPGDTFFEQLDRLSVQLHAYDLRQHRKVVATAAPLIALHIPPSLARDWLIQVQAGQSRNMPRR